MKRRIQREEERERILTAAVAAARAGFAKPPTPIKAGQLHSAMSVAIPKAAKTEHEAKQLDSPSDSEYDTILTQITPPRPSPSPMPSRPPSQEPASPITSSDEREHLFALSDVSITRNITLSGCNEDDIERVAAKMRAGEKKKSAVPVIDASSIEFVDYDDEETVRHAYIDHQDKLKAKGKAQADYYGDGTETEEQEMAMIEELAKELAAKKVQLVEKCKKKKEKLQAGQPVVHGSDDDIVVAVPAERKPYKTLESKRKTSKDTIPDSDDELAISDFDDTSTPAKIPKSKRKASKDAIYDSDDASILSEPKPSNTLKSKQKTSKPTILDSDDVCPIHDSDA